MKLLPSKHSLYLPALCRVAFFGLIPFSLVSSSFGQEPSTTIGLENIPVLHGHLHLKGVVDYRDVRTKAERSQYEANAKNSVILSGKAQHLPEKEVNLQLQRVTEAVRKASEPSERKIELWVMDAKWILREEDPKVKDDVFTGEGSGVTLWICDGNELLKVRENGFRCTRYRPGIRFVDDYPLVPPLGVIYTALPVALPANLPPDVAKKVKVVPGWSLAGIPSYVMFNSSPSSTFEVDTSPQHFPNYNTGYVHIDQTRDGFHVVEMRVGAYDRPIEQWLLSDYRATGSMHLAYTAVLNDFHTGPSPKPSFQRRFRVRSIDLQSFGDEVFSRDRYLKNGCQVQENVEYPGKPKLYKYQTGKSWEEMSSSAVQPEHKPEQLNAGIYIAGAAALGVSGVYAIRHLRKS